MKLFFRAALACALAFSGFSAENMFGYQTHFNNHNSHNNCHNPNHNHNHSRNCPNHYNNNHHCGRHNNCGHNSRVNFGVSFSYNTPAVYTYESPVTIVERNYYRPTRQIVKTYTRPAYTSGYGSTTVRRTYSSNPTVYESETVYSRPAVVRETVHETLLEPMVVCETVEYRNHHPLRALTDFAGAMIDAFVD